MRVLHFADLHLHSPFGQLGKTAAERKRNDIRRALEAMLGLAQEVGASAVFSAGDLFEDKFMTKDDEDFLQSVFAQIDPIRVFLAPGNHDYYQSLSPYEYVGWSGNVHVFKADHLEPVELKPGLTLWGAAFRRPHRTKGFLDRPIAASSGVHIGLFHGAETNEFPSQGEYGPFTVDQIRQTGLLHVFVGHYHKAVDKPLFTYPGNPEPLQFGEGGANEPTRGAVIADIEDGRITTQRRSVAVTLMPDVPVDVNGASNRNDVAHEIRERIRGVSGIPRVKLRGDIRQGVEILPEHLKLWADEMGVVFGESQLSEAFNYESIRAERTIRGQFVRDVEASTHAAEVKRRILQTGLRALDGRSDLEVL